MHRMSTTVVGIVLAAVAALFFGAFVLYGAWIDGRRQKVREQGKHPVTEADGSVRTREEERHG